MFKKTTNIVKGTIFFVVLLVVVLYAADEAKIKLTTADGTSTFAVKDSLDATVMSVDSDGNIKTDGNIDFKSGTGFYGTLDHAITAIKTWTFPDVGGEIRVGTVGIANGGTGEITANAAFNALSPMTTLGDIIYGGASGAGTGLTGNTTTAKQYLSQTGTGVVSAAPIWASIAQADVTGLTTDSSPTFAGITLSTTPLAEGSGGTSESTYTTGQILYASAANILNKLDIGTTSQVLTVSSTSVPVWSTRGMVIAMLIDLVGPASTNAPAGGAEIPLQLSRVKVDLTGFNECRVEFIIELATTAVGARIEYSTDGSSWFTLINNTAHNGVASTLTVGSWVSIPAGAKADVFLRAMAYGDGALDPNFTKIVVEVR